MTFCRLFWGRAKICTKLSFELARRLEMKNDFHHSSYLVEFYQNGSFGNFSYVGSRFPKGERRMCGKTFARVVYQPIFLLPRTSGGISDPTFDTGFPGQEKFRNFPF